MSMVDVTRELNRTRAAHVRIVLLDFFGSQPPEGEVREVVQLVADMHKAFNEVPAPEEPREG